MVVLALRYPEVRYKYPELRKILFYYDFSLMFYFEINVRTITLRQIFLNSMQEGRVFY